MTNDTNPPPGVAPGSPDRPRGAWGAIRIGARALQVRLRLIAILAAASVVVGQCDAIRTRWDGWTRGLIPGEAASRAVPPNVEYFCPMDPGVVAMRPGKCDICNMALVRRKVGDVSPLPSGVLARMQLSPYRVQLAGIRTAPVEYRPLAREVVLAGVVRDDGRVGCRVPEHELAFVVVGQAADVVADDRPGAAVATGEVAEVGPDPREPRAAEALIRLAGPARGLTPGCRVSATVRRPIAELEPFRSLPADPPPLSKGDLLAVYACPRHPEVLATDRGPCPIDGDDRLQRRPLLGNQRVGWWCPMHPGVAAGRDGATCPACGGMKLVARVITYRPPGRVLVVPESAVVDTGTCTVAFVEQMPGMFDGVEIVVGPRCGDVYPVAGGLDPGGRVAVRGAFLLDAETRLNPGVAASYFGASRAARDATPDRPGAADRPLCPVTGKPLGSMGPPVTIEVDGRAVRLCCEGCEAPLRRSPAKYLPGPTSR